MLGCKGLNFKQMKLPKTMALVNNSDDCTFSFNHLTVVIFVFFPRPTHRSFHSCGLSAAADRAECRFLRCGSHL